MLKKIILFYSLFILASFSMMSCHHNDDPTPYIPQDSITITSITPSTGLVDGQSTSFTIEVNYKLATKNQGELNIGFNTDDYGIGNVNTSELIVSATVIVAKGSGTHTFNVTATPKKWSSGAFKAYVNLSANPHPASWVPLANDYKKLSFQ